MKVKERVETVRVSGMVDEIGQQGKEERVLGFFDIVGCFSLPVRVSFENFRSLPHSFLEDEVEEESEEEEEEGLCVGTFMCVQCLHSFSSLFFRYNSTTPEWLSRTSEVKGCPNRRCHKT